MSAEAPEARNTKPPTTSSKRPSRPSLILAEAKVRDSGSARKGVIIGVSMKVGHKLLTRSPLGPNSAAIALVRPSMACFVAQYTVRLGPPT